MEKQWKKVGLLGLVMLLSPFMLLASAASPRDEAVFLRDTENGPILVQGPGLPSAGGVTTLPSPYVVWSHYLADAIYNTTSNTVDGYVFAGTYLNPPKEAELFALGGGGIPEWGYGGTEFYTDAGDGAFTLAAVDEDGSGVKVIKWTGPGNGTPDWTMSFPGYGVTSYGPIAVSDDGSTIAAIAAPPGTDAHLLLFDADSSAPLVNYVASGLGFPRCVKITADGCYTAFIASATIVVYDRDLLNVRDQMVMGFSNSALDISGDGNLVAYGWPSLILMEWNGLSYQQLWSWSAGGGYYVTRIAISTDGTTMVSCWYNTPHTTIKVVVHNVGSSTPLWTHDYPQSSGVYQEAAGDVDITDDGNYFIVGSWGDAENINPEVHIFSRDDSAHTYYTVDMPGSVFSVDIFSDGRYATACGKHVHANQMGRGGDIVMIDTDITAVPHSDFANLPSESLLLDNYPNPFTHSTTIRYHLSRGEGEQGRGGDPSTHQRINLSVYDLSGRLVKTLFDGGQEVTGYELPVAVRWGGRDDSGVKVPSGIYLLRLRVGAQNATRKLLVLR